MPGAMRRWVTDHLLHSDPIVQRFESWARARLALGFDLDEAARAVEGDAGLDDEFLLGAGLVVLGAERAGGEVLDLEAGDGAEAVEAGEGAGELAAVVALLLLEVGRIEEDAVAVGDAGGRGGGRGHGGEGRFRLCR